MPVTKRAWLYVRRNRKRTLLLFLLFTALLTLSFSGFAFSTASMEAMRELRGGIGGYFTIHSGAEGGRADEALFERAHGLEHVRAWSGADTYYLCADGLALEPARWHGTGTAEEFTPKFIGCTDTALHERFLSFAFRLTEGRQIGPEDEGAAMLSEAVAARNGLSVGDKLRARGGDGVRDWAPGAAETWLEFEIVGIYATTRSEPVSPTKAERELQENIVFTDIRSAKRVFALKFPGRAADEYVYSSGIQLFPDDPARMGETIERLKEQVDADWEHLAIVENSAAYQQAAGPIQKAAAISRLLLAVVLAVSAGILTLTLLLWTRERMAEIGVLVSLGVPVKEIFLQLLLENYLTALPAVPAALALGAGLSARLGGALGMEAGLGAGQAAAVLCCAAGVVLLAAALVSLSLLRKRPSDILTEWN